MAYFGQRSPLLLATLAWAMLPAFGGNTPRHRPQETQAEAAKAELPASAHDLIQRAIDRQMEKPPHPEFSTWKEKDVKPRGSSVRQLIETPDGVLARYLERNGQPLTLEERQREDARVNRLMDPAQMKQKAKQQKDDEDRTLKMLKAIPDAFFFSYGESTRAANGDTLAHVNFKPNPNFDPPTRECLVFEGMQGEVIVDVEALRITKIDGTLFRDVNIGWGLIGHLDKGGRFLVEQQEVYRNHWDQTHMFLDFTGKALIFKSIRIKDDSTAWEFQPVEMMDVRSALAYLKNKEDGAGRGTAEAAK